MTLEIEGVLFHQVKFPEFSPASRGKDEYFNVKRIKAAWAHTKMARQGEVVRQGGLERPIDGGHYVLSI